MAKDILTDLAEQALSEEMLDEAAKTVQEAVQEGYALLVMDDGVFKVIVLYEPEAFAEILNGNAFQNGLDDPENAIVGYMQLDTRYVNVCGAYIVASSAARKGYGPLLYDIAMSVISPQSLAADRESVSSSARKVWNYLLTTRANDFTIKQMPSKGACVHDNLNPNDKSLNYSFAIKNKVDTSRLVGNHKNAIRQIGTTNGDPVQELKKLGEDYFTSRYNE